MFLAKIDPFRDAVFRMIHAYMPVARFRLAGLSFADRKIALILRQLHALVARLAPASTAANDRGLAVTELDRVASHLLHAVLGRSPSGMKSGQRRFVKVSQLEVFVDDLRRRYFVP